jgi:hypothetical protein
MAESVLALVSSEPPMKSMASLICCALRVAVPSVSSRR